MLELCDAAGSVQWRLVYRTTATPCVGLERGAVGVELRQVGDAPWQTQDLRSKGAWAAGVVPGNTIE